VQVAAGIDKISVAVEIIVVEDVTTAVSWWIC